MVSGQELHLRCQHMSLAMVMFVAFALFELIPCAMGHWSRCNDLFDLDSPYPSGVCVYVMPSYATDEQSHRCPDAMGQRPGAGQGGMAPEEQPRV
jgi:hypothetical protein